MRILMGLLVKGAIASTGLLIGISASEALPTESASDVSLSPALQQLQQTRSCVGCNLSNLDLRDLDLVGVNLQNANLSNTNLSGSNLSQANLTGANFYLAQMVGSNLSQAQLTQAQLNSANLSNANLTQSVFEQTLVTYANLSKAQLTAASIQNSNFSDSNLTQANFASARISNTTFNYSNLDQASFQSASIEGDIFRTASTTGTLFPTSATEANELGDRPSTLASELAPNVISQVPSEPELGIESEAEAESEPGLESESAPEEAPSVEVAPVDTISDEADELLRISPLSNNVFPQVTAKQLRRGEVVLGFPTNRQFFNEDTEENSATAANLGVHVDWGITDSTELGVSFQIVDTGSPEFQGPFDVRREDNRDVTIRVKQRVWNNKNNDLAVSVVPSLAVGDRSTEFVGVGPLQEFNNNAPVPALQIPVTKSFNQERLNLTLSPTAVFFRSEQALFLRTLPLPDSGSFGTNFGLAGAVSYAVNPRLTLWGDAFVPFVGNNSLNLESGLPVQTVAFNTGLRFLVNPRLGLDLFASNTLGQRTPLGITAEQNNVAIGFGLSVLPELFSGNRKYADTFNRNDDGIDSPLTVDGLGFADGGTVPKNRFALQFQGGQQGLLSSLRYGVARDFEVFGFLDYISSDVDESEQGFGVKVRLLDQQSNGPVTISATASVSLTNEVFQNVIDDDPTAFDALGIDRDVPLVFQADSPDGRRFIVAASLPIHYQVNDRLNTWFTPTVAIAQRQDGLDLGGFSLGGSLEFIKDVSVVAEVGANFIGPGNSFGSDGLVDRVPWTLAARWNPSAVLGRSRDALVQPHIELFVTNRNGSSIWNQLRVREGGDPAVGVGIQLPF